MVKPCSCQPACRAANKLSSLDPLSKGDHGIPLHSILCIHDLIDKLIDVWQSKNEALH
jgi:uncharacterized protein (UPF0147 family)